MPIEMLDFARPFFGVCHVTGEPGFHVDGRAIVVNLGQHDILVEDRALPALASAIIQEAELCNVENAVAVSDFDHSDDEPGLFERVRATWPSAYDVRREERLRGVCHYMSPKCTIGNIALTMYHSGSVPLNVGLHREHPFCPVPEFREVHTQIVGVGKMQQCRERDVKTLYLEELMAPGATHRPMYDPVGTYPWHQYETVTPGIFMAVEMLPEGMSFSEMEAGNG